MVFSQNLPVIIHPAGTAVNIEPRKALTADKNGNVTVENNTPYVVRLEQKVKLMASGTIATLAKTYILPGENDGQRPSQNISIRKQIEIYPATRYGYKAGKYIADLQQ